MERNKMNNIKIKKHPHPCYTILNVLIIDDLFNSAFDGVDTIDLSLGT